VRDEAVPVSHHEHDVDIEVPEGWSVTDDGKMIEIEVETEDFMEAVDLFNELAEIAEDQMHHPDFHIEEYNQVRITSWSHDVGGLSERDEELSQAITQVLEKRDLL
jgi:4a-hydroxytetrahydrobiopterin dehydratase